MPINNIASINEIELAYRADNSDGTLGAVVIVKRQNMVDELLDARRVTASRPTLLGRRVDDVMSGHPLSQEKENFK